MTRQYLGQNFLIDQSVLKNIAEHFHPPGSFGEIGPGHGELTNYLEKKFNSFVLFEKDQKLVQVHREANRKIIAGDFLNWDFCLQGEPVKDFSFIGNLPYEAGTAIVKRICEKSDQCPYFLFLLQKEVVERITAKPHSRDFGSLTVLVQGQYEVEALDIVPPEAFKPAPKVMSQLVRGHVKQDRQSLDRNYQLFVQSSFLHKRKTFRNALKSKFSKEQIDRVFEGMRFNPMVRAEEIPVADWPRLFKAFQDGR